MRQILRNTAFAAVAASTALTAIPERAAAQGYQIDCAILLCLSGGWPASVPCARARAEFIRRITPWPIEPPLQIWRCPMSISYDGPAPSDPMEQIYDIMAPAQPRQSFPLGDPFAAVAEANAADEASPSAINPASSISAIVRMNGASDYQQIEPTLAVETRSGGSPMPEDFRLYLAQAVGTGADIDVSDIAFDFIRSIDVFQVQLRQRESGRDNDCNRSASVRRGTYDETGQFSWRNESYTRIPEAFVGDERYPGNCPDVWVRAVFVDWNDYEGNYGFEQVNY